jgi:hypothetical protein
MKKVFWSSVRYCANFLASDGKRVTLGLLGIAALLLIMFTLNHDLFDDDLVIPPLAHVQKNMSKEGEHLPLIHKGKYVNLEALVSDNKLQAQDISGTHRAWILSAVFVLLALSGIYFALVALIHKALPVHGPEKNVTSKE